MEVNNASLYLFVGGSNPDKGEKRKAMRKGILGEVIHENWLDGGAFYLENLVTISQKLSSEELVIVKQV